MKFLNFFRSSIPLKKFDLRFSLIIWMTHLNRSWLFLSMIHTHEIIKIRNLKLDISHFFDQIICFFFAVWNSIFAYQNLNSKSSASQNDRFRYSQCFFFLKRKNDRIFFLFLSCKQVARSKWTHRNSLKKYK